MRLDVAQCKFQKTRTGSLSKYQYETLIWFEDNVMK